MPTTGLCVIALLLQSVEQLYLHGFSFTTAHFFEENSNVGTRHDYDRERRVVNVWMAKGRVRHFPVAEAPCMRFTPEVSVGLVSRNGPGARTPRPAAASKTAFVAPNADVAGARGTGFCTNVRTRGRNLRCLERDSEARDDG